MIHESYLQSGRTNNRNAKATEMHNSNASSPKQNRQTNQTFHSKKTEIRNLKTQTESGANLTEYKFQTPSTYGTANNSPAICQTRTLLQTLCLPITLRPTMVVHWQSKAPNTQEINKRQPTPQRAQTPGSKDK